MGKKIRICVVAPLYHPSFGGLGRQAQLLTERLTRSGVQAFVIARRMKGMTPTDFSPEVKVFRAWSIKPYIHTFEKVNINNILISLTFALSCALLLIRKRNEYDIVHFHGASLPLFVNIVLLKFLGKRVLAKVASANLGIEAGCLAGRYLGLGNFIIKLLSMADAFVATTDEIEHGLKADGFSEEKIRKIPNFIDFDLFMPAGDNEKAALRKKLEFGNDICILFCGRFIHRKGIDCLLKAWKSVKTEFTDTKLILLGDGPLFKTMKDLARKLDISDSVDFRGHAHNVTDFLRAADIFVLPSLQEGMPNSLLEAMACGLAPVATRIGGAIDIIVDEKSGIFANPGDARDLATKILTLINNGNLTNVIALNAYERIRDNYHLDNIVPRYYDLYRNLLNKTTRDN